MVDRFGLGVALMGNTEHLPSGHQFSKLERRQQAEQTRAEANHKQPREVWELTAKTQNRRAKRHELFQ